MSDAAGDTASAPARGAASSPGAAAAFAGLAAPWVALALLFTVLPMIFASGSALTMLSLLIAITRFEREIWEGAALGFWAVCVYELFRRDGAAWAEGEIPSA